MNALTESQLRHALEVIESAIAQARLALRHAGPEITPEPPQAPVVKVVVPPIATGNFNPAPPTKLTPTGRVSKVPDNSTQGRVPGSRKQNPHITTPKPGEPVELSLMDACREYNLGRNWIEARLKSGQITGSIKPSKGGNRHVYFVNQQSLRALLISGVRGVYPVKPNHNS